MKRYWITKQDAERIVAELYSFDPLRKRLERQMGIKPPPPPKPDKDQRECRRYMARLFRKLGMRP